jgi:ATP-dependent helicase/nuclease subunit A
VLAYLSDPSSSLRRAAFLRSRFVRLSDEALVRLAADQRAGPRERSGQGPVAPDPRSDEERRSNLAADDRARLDLVDQSLAAWLPLVDRLPPAELLDRVLSDSAYAAELAGPGLAQARENLKKIRGLVRRMQNRGYLTLERLVAHFARLVAGGDESSAIVDAVDAVNLMTVHAAKGLEFPVVFIVNLGRGGAGGRDPIRISPPAFRDEDDDPDEGEAAVGVGDHEVDADRDADLKEQEETKRLLYVAFTRARDRLYLSAVFTNQGLLTVRGSLGRMLPASLAAALGAARAARGGELAWAGATAEHRFRVVGTPGASPCMWRLPAPPAGRSDDFEPI